MAQTECSTLPAHLPVNIVLPVPVSARSKAWVCGLPPAEIVGSNPAGACLSLVSVFLGLCERVITSPGESY